MDRIQQESLLLQMKIAITPKLGMTQCLQVMTSPTFFSFAVDLDQEI